MNSTLRLFLLTLSFCSTGSIELVGSASTLGVSRIACHCTRPYMTCEKNHTYCSDCDNVLNSFSGTCAICNDAVSEENRQRLSCGHIFCGDCIQGWLNDHETCPTCRGKVQPAFPVPGCTLCKALQKPSNLPLVHTVVSVGNRTMLRALLDQKVDCTIRAEDGKTPLHRVIENGQKALFDILLEYNVPVDPCTRAGESPLHLAVRKSSTEMVRQLLGRKVNVKAQDLHGQTPLHYAAHAEIDTAEISELLIAAGSTIDHVDGAGKTALHYAAESNPIITKYLMDNGAQKAIFDAKGFLPFHYVRRPACLDIFVMHHGTEVDSRTQDGKTLLHILCELPTPMTRMVNTLLDRGADKSLKDSLGRIPLSIAQSNPQQAAVVQALSRPVQQEGRQAILKALLDEAIKALQLDCDSIINDYPIRSLSQKGLPEVHLAIAAAEQAKNEIIRLGEANPLKGCDVLGAVLAARKSRERIARLVHHLRVLELAVDQQHEDNLLFAARDDARRDRVNLRAEISAVRAVESETAVSEEEEGRRNIERLAAQRPGDQLLIEEANQLIDAEKLRNEHIRTRRAQGLENQADEAAQRERELYNQEPLDAEPIENDPGAKQREQDELRKLRYLEELKKNEFTRKLLKWGGTGVLVLGCVYWFYKQYIFQRAKELNEVAGANDSKRLSELLEQGYDVRGYDNLGETALHSAAEKGTLESVRLLLEKGALIDAKNSAGETPLFGAVKNSRLGVVRELLKNKAHIDAQSKSGATPLHGAILNDDSALVKELLEKGANGKLPDNVDKKTAAESARERLRQLPKSSIRKEIVELFKTYKQL